MNTMNWMTWVCIVEICHCYVNIAFEKPAYQQYPYIIGNATFDARNAVDGRKSDKTWEGGQCAFSAQKETATWWVNLTSIHSIHHITIYFMTNNVKWDAFNYFPPAFLGFSLYVSNTTDNYQFHGKLCFKDNNFTTRTLPAVFNITCPLHGQYVIFYNERIENVAYPSDYTEYVENSLCEVEVYGCSEEGFYGYNCSIPCPDVNCQYCHIETGTCQGCKPGYQGDGCKSVCPHGFFGQGCANICKDTCNGCNNVNGICDSGCLSGWNGESCQKPCKAGSYGVKCNETCGHCRDSNDCFRRDGLCLTGCEVGYHGSLCKSVCSHGFFGQDCADTCYDTCNDCNKVSGLCDLGCNPGWKGDYCHDACDNGTYGFDCNETCGHCRDVNQCMHSNGLCLTGCDFGYQGTLCKTRCKKGSYGIDCQSTCGHCHDIDQCFHINGTCLTGCDGGFQDDLCKTPCEHGLYGVDCKETCGQCCEANQCFHINGTCLNGCNAGYQGEHCKAPCGEHFFGIDCTQMCDKNCVNQACHHVTGECISPPMNLSIFGGIIVAFAVTFLVGIIIYRARNGTCIQKSNRFMTDETAVAFTSNIYSLSSTLPRILHDIPQRYTEDNEVQISSPSRKMSEIPCKITQKVRKGEELEEDDVDERQQEEKSYGYLQIKREPLIPDIAVNDIKKVTQKYSDNDDDGYKKEYETLIFGKRYPCEIAKLPANIPKNRFKTVFPYDHSRVKLVDKDSDYINANYIDGFGQEQVYIATQGPKQNTVGDFWLMVWQENVSQIVMLTSVMEGKKAKCVQYWPDLGTDINCDVFTINTSDQRQYAYYVIRRMKIRHTTQNESRIITQYHYTSWPDHGVPDPLCLLLFRNYVTRSRYVTCGSHKGPTLVHCSAGIGRTGTYIAIDALYEEGQMTGKINIAEFVKKMREKRMNMVQTYEQYKTIFLTLHLMFMSPATVLSTMEFLQKLHTATTENPTSGSLLRNEFKKLQSVCPQYTEEDYKIATQYGELSSIRPLDNYIIYLTSSVPRRGNYINAITLPSFTNRDAFIITHYPTHGNTMDLQRLITDSESEVVVCLEPITNSEYDDIWQPTAVGFQTANRIIVQQQTEHVAEIKCRKIKIISERIYNETHSIEWAEPLFNLIPANSKTVSQILSLVSFSRNVESERPIIIISRDGAVLCDVFCAVYNLIQQLTIDEEIDVFSVVRLLQTRRPELCNSLEEYELIYKSLFRFLNSYQDEHIYSNQHV